MSACTKVPTTEYTLYRTGIDIPTHTQDESLRIHIATFNSNVETFDSNENDKYNRSNCDFSQELFENNQPPLRGSIWGDIKLKYWCEKGPFRK